MKRTDDKGAIAFFTYWLEVYHYSYLTTDPAPVGALSDPDCVFCTNAMKDIKGLRDRSRTVVGGEVTVDWAFTPAKDARLGALVSSAISQQETRTFTPTGQQASLGHTDKGLRVDALVALKPTGWVMMELHPFKPGES